MEKTIDYKGVAQDYAVKNQKRRELFAEFAQDVHTLSGGRGDSTWKTCDSALCQRARELALKGESF